MKYMTTFDYKQNEDFGTQKFSNQGKSRFEVKLLDSKDQPSSQ